MANVLLSRSINPKQVNMSDYLYLKGWDTENEIGLIEWLCGWGKTYISTSTAANSILQKINSEFGLGIQPYEVLFLVSRAAIREQSLASYSATLREVNSVEELENIGFIEEPHKIRIATYHKIGGELEEGKNVPNSVKLVICDEFHSVFADTFASQMFAIKKWLSETPIIRIGLTATPQPLEYLNGSRHWTQEKCAEQFGFKFRDIAAQTEPRFRFGQFHVYNGSMSAETAFREFRGNEDGKAIFFTFSARTASKICRDNEDTLLFISEGNDKTDATGTLLRDYMDYENNNRLLRDKQIPQGFNNVIATSCFREGVDLKDGAVKRIVIQSFLPHEIIQSLGRFRNNVDDVYIIANRAAFEMTQKQCNRAFELLENYLASNDEHILIEQYNRQRDADSPDDTQWFVNKYRGKYEIDYSIFIYWLYVFDSWYATTTYRNDEFITFLRKRLPNRKDYYRLMFSKYTDNEIIPESWDKTRTRVSLVNERKSKIDDVIAPYLNKKLFANSDERDELVRSIGAIDEYGFSRKWTTVKKWLREAGYVIEDGREKNKHYSVIHL